MTTEQPSQNQINAITSEHTTLEKLLNWCLSHTPPIRIAAIVAQDEFTNDVIVPFENVFLVYDTT